MWSIIKPAIFDGSGSQAHIPPSIFSYRLNKRSVKALLPVVGNLTPNTVNTPDATKYCPIEMAFSLIHSGAAPATGSSLTSSPRLNRLFSFPTLTISAKATRILLLSTHEPACRTGGMPTASHTSAKPGPAFSAAVSGCIKPAFAAAIAEHPVCTTRTSLAINSSISGTCAES